jgi:hypothetical protein
MSSQNEYSLKAQERRIFTGMKSYRKEFPWEFRVCYLALGAGLISTFTAGFLSDFVMSTETTPRLPLLPRVWRV